MNTNSGYSSQRSAAERNGQRLVHPGLPGPQPHRVDVGVSYHVDYHELTNPLRLCELAVLPAPDRDVLP